MSLPVILVTGGAGYVGSHTVLELLNNNYTVVVVDNLVNAHKDKGADLPEALKRVEKLTGRTVHFYSVDLQDKEGLIRIFNNVSDNRAPDFESGTIPCIVVSRFLKYKIDCVMHFAALKAVGESCQIPLTYYQNNITGSSVLLEVMKTHGVYKLVYSSSATVYGVPQYLPLDEKHPTGQGCTNPYGKSKYFVEEIMKDLCSSDQSWGIISLRYFNPVGAHESGEIGEDPLGVPNNLMPFIAQVASGKLSRLQIFGSDYSTHDGTGVRDYIHISDLSAGHVSSLKCILKPEFNGFMAFNLGTGKGYSVLDVLKSFEKACGKKIPYVLAPRRPGDIDSSYADASLAEKTFNWKATKNIDNMCIDTWRWQQSNPLGFKSN